MVNKIIAVGTTTQNDTFVNGQSMMFQLFIDKLEQKNIHIKIIDFGVSILKNTNDSRVSGKFSIIKTLDNFILLFKYIFALIENRKAPIYITTSQSQVGFVRDFLFIALANFLGNKIIIQQFGSNYENFYLSLSPSFRKRIKSTLEKVDKIIVEGEFTKEQFSFVNDYKNKVIVIPNGLPEVIDNNISPKSIKNSQPIKLIYLSNLIESKGYWDVLDAIDILVNIKNKNIHAVFAGKFLEDVDDKKFDTSEKARSAFFNFLENKNLKNRIDYHEGLYKKAKSEAFKNAHFFLLPSYYRNEGQPVSVLEALAYGCVPIVTNYRLISTMVNNENGVFVNPKSPQEIADVIENLINHDQKYKEYSQAGINFYLDNFTADKYVDNLIRLF